MRDDADAAGVSHPETTMTKLAKILLATTTLLTLGAGAVPALAQGARYAPTDPRFDGTLPLRGAGVPLLFPELRDSPRGRAFVIPDFDADGDGRIDPREAREANRAFAQIAGPRRGRFDWAVYDRGPRRGDRVEERGGRWDERAMRGYGFRQTTRGATMRLDEDVLFATDSAVLRPGANAKLEALADYLRSEPGVRVAIDGYTDSRGSDAHNQALSERRADAVRTAFDEMGVTRARFAVVGHGEADPVATNATPQGMRQNRRVEVTLLGQRADRF